MVYFDISLIHHAWFIFFLSISRQAEGLKIIVSFHNFQWLNITKWKLDILAFTQYDDEMDHMHGWIMVVCKCNFSWLSLITFLKVCNFVYRLDVSQLDVLIRVELGWP